MTEGEMVSKTDSKDMNLSKFWEIVEDRGPWQATVHRVAESDMTEQLNTSTCARNILCQAPRHQGSLQLSLIIPHTSLKLHLCARTRLQREADTDFKAP